MKFVFLYLLWFFFLVKIIVNHELGVRYLPKYSPLFFETHENELIEYLVDISLHLLKSEAESDIRVISNISITPNCLLQKSILVDEARGEAELFSDIYC